MRWCLLGARRYGDVWWRVFVVYGGYFYFYGTVFLIILYVQSEWDVYMLRMLTQLFRETFVALKKYEAQQYRNRKNSNTNKQKNNTTNNTNDTKEHKSSSYFAVSSSNDDTFDSSIKATVEIRTCIRLYPYGKKSNLRLYNTMLRQYGVSITRMSHYKALIFVDTSECGPFPRKFVRGMWQAMCANNMDGDSDDDDSDDSDIDDDDQAALAEQGKLLLRRAPST